MRFALPFAAALLALFASLAACKEPPGTLLEPRLRFAIAYDPDQARLDNVGAPASPEPGRAGQVPDFRDLRVFTLELIEDPATLPGQGLVLFRAPETDAGGALAIDFDRLPSTSGGQLGEIYDLADFPPGTYRYARVSVAYQNYGVRFNLVDTSGSLADQQGYVSSFLGYNTYIGTVTPFSEPLDINDDRLQGFWAFETQLDPPFDAFDQVLSGQAPVGATTVVNPLAGISDIPAGSCIITGAFDEPLTITGGEESGILVTLSFSTNDSFEWVDSNGNGDWDFFLNTGVIEQVVDMGLRGLEVRWQDGI